MKRCLLNSILNRKLDESRKEKNAYTEQLRLHEERATITKDRDDDLLVQPNESSLLWLKEIVLFPLRNGGGVFAGEERELRNTLLVAAAYARAHGTVVTYGTGVGPGQGLPTSLSASGIFLLRMRRFNFAVRPCQRWQWRMLWLLDLLNVSSESY